MISVYENLAGAVKMLNEVRMNVLSQMFVLRARDGLSRATIVV
ncbi:hypothetical protein [Streptomyces sp. 2A115]